jgi:hypothetical protein
MPVESDGVAHAAGESLLAAAVRFHARDRGVAVRVRLTNIARRADRDIKHAVGSEGDKLPAVAAIAGKAAVDYHRLRFTAELRLDVIVA